MRVVADSHSLLYYLFTPDQLSDRALEARGGAENTAGVVVSTATIGDLWYASHEEGRRALTPGAFELLRSTVFDPATAFIVNLSSFGPPMDTWNLSWAAESVSGAVLRRLPCP